MLKIIRDVLKERYVPYIIRLNDLLGKDTLRDFMRYGEDFLTIRNDRHLSIKTLTGCEIAREIYPPALSAIVTENFRTLEDELLDYVNKRRVHEEITSVDITDLFYEKDAKGKNMLKKALNNDKPIISYMHNGSKINLAMKFDLPPRNTLRRLEKSNPVIMLHITDLKGLLEYKTTITLDNNDVIMTNNIYSNKILKKKKA